VDPREKSSGLPFTSEKEVKASNLSIVVGLHFLEVNMFEQKALISIFRANPRKTYGKAGREIKQLKLFDY